MGTFTIIEYVGQGMQAGQSIPCAQEPPIAEQAAITTSASSQRSAALNAQTRIALVQTTSIVRIKGAIGTSATASATISQRMAADESRYLFFEPGATNYINVIDAT